MEIKKFESPVSVSFHAVENGMSIGVIDASLSPSDVLINGESIKDSWYFNRIFVKPQCRKRGIASKLMTEFISFIRKKKIFMVCDINAYGDMDREQLSTFYQKFGFVEVPLSYHDISYSSYILDAR